MGFISWFWLALTVLLGIVEAATAGLVCVWFVPGAAAALLISLLGGSVPAQGAALAVLSAAALALTRPLVRKLHGETVPTNLDRVIGKAARVTETVDAENGAVYVDGKTWTARSAGGAVFPVGTQVYVERMEGVKLFVKNETEVTNAWN